MRERSLFASTVALTTLALIGAAAAGSLSCRSVNGNLVCAAPDAASCQTVDGKTVCINGSGDALQIFGASPTETPDALEEDEALEIEEMEGESALPPVPAAPQRLVIERRGPGGRTLSLWRDGRRLHVDTGRVRLDID